jgi:hypothetical protein
MTEFYWGRKKAWQTDTYIVDVALQVMYESSFSPYFYELEGTSSRCVKPEGSGRPWKYRDENSYMEKDSRWSVYHIYRYITKKLIEVTRW